MWLNEIIFIWRQPLRIRIRFGIVCSTCKQTVSAFVIVSERNGFSATVVGEKNCWMFFLLKIFLYWCCCVNSCRFRLKTCMKWGRTCTLWSRASSIEHSRSIPGCFESLRHLACRLWTHWMRQQPPCRCTKKKKHFVEAELNESEHEFRRWKFWMFLILLRFKILIFAKCRTL